MNLERVGYITLQALKKKPNDLSKTKWNKLLFFTDLVFFTYDDIKYKNKIYTGLEYIKMPYGPVVKDYDYVIFQICKEYNLRLENYVGYSSSYSSYIEKNGKNINKLVNIDDEEKGIIKKVIDKFASVTAVKLSNFSHLMTPWKKADNYEDISFISTYQDVFISNDKEYKTFYDFVVKTGT
jgi:uncharacterized phage-associated protein